MKAIKVVSLMFAVTSGALVHAHEEQNEAETRPAHEAHEQRTLPEEVEIGEYGADFGRTDLGEFQQLFDAEEGVDVSGRLSDTRQG